MTTTTATAAAGSAVTEKSVLDLAYEAREKACSGQVCAVTKKGGADYIVQVSEDDGKTYKDVGYVKRLKRDDEKNGWGQIAPDASSPSPADQLAAALKGQGVKYRIVPSAPLRVFFEACEAEKQKAQAGNINAFLQTIKKADSGSKTQPPPAKEAAPAKGGLFSSRKA